MLRLTLLIFAIVWGILILALVIAAHADAERFDQEENIFWGLVNKYRQENNVQSVGLNDNLMSAAEWMSNDMTSNNYYSHTDSLGRDLEQRLIDFGYLRNRAIGVGEILAAGWDTAQEAFNAFKNSPKHNEIMLNKNFWAIGIARAHNENSTYGWYWTINFGMVGPAWFPTTSTTSTPTPTPIAEPAEFPKTGG